jgi:DNA-binding GntR family transcriptional regulator
MSRSPIREALVRLAAEGLLTSVPNRATVVTPMDLGRIPEFLDALDLLQRVVTRLAALNRSADDLRAIRAAQVGYERGIAASMKSGDSLHMIETNVDFHMAIARASHNSYFADLYQKLLDEGRRMLHLHFQFKSLDPNMSVAEMAADHTGMVEAIEARDGDRAEALAHEHAMQFRGTFQEFMGRNTTSLAAPAAALRAR